MELIKKLRIDTQQPLLILNLPDSCRPLFDGLDVQEKAGRQKPAEQLIIFATDSKVLVHELNRYAAWIGHNTLLWLCYPKKSGGNKSDLTAMEAWQVVFDMGYRGQTSAAIDSTWSALRVTNAPRKEPSQADIPMAERKDEGIDYVNRTATLPADALAAVQQHKGLEAYFYGQSFTCKKEYVLAINDAKKEETRKRRIDQMVAALLPKMAAKEMKGKK